MKILGVLFYILFLRIDSLVKRNKKIVDYVNEKEVGWLFENFFGVKYVVCWYK